MWATLILGGLCRTLVIVFVIWFHYALSASPLSPHLSEDVLNESKSIVKQSIPALQRHVCIACGSPADSYCGRCGVTPYCSQKCQMMDWQKRHRSVCHNLSRDNLPDQRSKGPAVVLPTASNHRSVSPHKSLGRKEKRDGNAINGDRERVRTQNNQTNNIENKNQCFKRYNNLREPKVISQKNEESFKIEDTRAKSKNQESSPVNKKPIPIDQEPKSVNQEPKPLARERVQPKPGPSKDIKLSTAADTATVKNIPENYLIETLAVGETVILTVDMQLTESAEKSYVCLSLHPSASDDCDSLCYQFSVDCEKAEDYMPKIGEVFAYCNPEDESWYRARKLSTTSAALLDAAHTAALPARAVALPRHYAHVPEFSCVLAAPDVQVGDNLKCTITSKSQDKCTVAIVNMDKDSVPSEGEVYRWRPKIESIAAPVIPEVERPSVKNKMKVYLVECNSVGKVFIRPTDMDSCREFDSIQEEVLLYGKNASPIKDNPQKGQIVIAKFTDGLWYRALCRRTNHSLNKYQLEYIEYGNIETQTKQDIYNCPDNLARPTVVMCVRLSGLTEVGSLPRTAVEYLHGLRDDFQELVVTLENSVQSAPTGSYIKLHRASNKECVNEKLLEASTPEWKKLEKQGVDVVEVPRIMMTDMTYVPLEESCELDVFIDMATLIYGYVNARPKLPGLDEKLKRLTDKMMEYCNSELGKEPYLPAHEELCIALCPPYPQWFRAVLCEQVGGPGGALVRLCYIDYGNLETIPVTSVRKMLPEFMEELPALSLQVNIRGFPQKASTEIMVKVINHMQPDEEGRGVLKVTNCKGVDFGTYDADAPALSAALS